MRVLSVDPGVNLGLAILELVENKVNVLDVHTLKIDNYIEKFLPEILRIEGITIARTIAIEENIVKLLRTWQIDHLCHETAYSSHGRMGFGRNVVEPFAKLRENILAIKLAYRLYDKDSVSFAINPMTVKTVVVGERSNDKDAVSRALLSKTDIEFDCEINGLDQHSWDAIAIGYTFLKTMRGSRNEFIRNSKGFKRYKGR